MGNYYRMHLHENAMAAIDRQLWAEEMQRYNREPAWHPHEPRVQGLVEGELGTAESFEAYFEEWQRVQLRNQEQAQNGLIGDQQVPNPAPDEQ